MAETAKWYVVHTYSGYENTVKATIEKTVESRQLQDQILAVSIPLETVTEITESGVSSWEYLQNVIPAGYKEHQEVAVTIAAAKHFLHGEGAVRVHGGGFAGTVQAFVPLTRLDSFKTEMEAILGKGRCHILSIRPEGGAVL